MNLPEKFCERMKNLLGDEYNDFLNSLDTQINRGVRINSLKVSDTDLVAKQLGFDDKVEWCKSGYYAKDRSISGNHPYHAAGIIYFQEPSAMCVADGLPVHENSKILDLCAAPGGKTTHIAARMNNTGLLVSNEIIKKRAAILSENVERMGLTNTIVTNESPSKLAEKFPLFFDCIIVDAPCSGEGMFRKEPQAVEEWSLEHTLSCAVRQKNILDDAYKMLKPGGYIMYSTCTFSFDENECIVRYMVEKYDMEICDIPCLSLLSAGVGDFPNIEKCRRIFPHLKKGEGHFTALLRKSDSDQEIRQKKIVKRQNHKPDSILDSAIKQYRDFEKKSINISLDGEFVLFGDNLYLLPEKVDIEKIKVLRCGLHLGTVKRGRFEPSHALSHALGIENYINVVDFNIDDNDLKKYMHGDVIKGDLQGWCIISVNSYPIGWGKASGGVIKNHYPKALRTLNI